MERYKLSITKREKECCGIILVIGFGSEIPIHGFPPIKPLVIVFQGVHYD